MNMISWGNMLPKSNLPNILSVLRALLGFVIVYFIYNDKYVTALIIFVIAAISDCLDGYIARKHQSISIFGKIIDPIADKILILATLFGFTLKDILLPCFVIIIGLRELVITLIRLYLLKNDTVLAAKDAGKFKTVLQIGVIIIIFAWRILNDFYPAVSKQNVLLYNSVNFLMVIPVVVTLSSMVVYFKDIKKLF